MTFKQVIVRLLEQSDLNKKQFSEKVGISKQSLYNYENGNSEPSFSEACRIVKASETKELVIIEKFKTNA